jgi:hypothetical protein
MTASQSGGPTHAPITFEARMLTRRCLPCPPPSRISWPPLSMSLRCVVAVTSLLASFFSPELVRSPSCTNADHAPPEIIHCSTPYTPCPTRLSRRRFVVTPACSFSSCVHLHHVAIDPEVWRKDWTEEDMQAALATLRQRDNKLSLREVARRFDVDHSTLSRSAEHEQAKTQSCLIDQVH